MDAAAEFELVRVAVIPDGAFGVLKHEGVPCALTLERTFGEEDRVVIPEGVWPCKRTLFYRRGYPTYEVIIPGHDRVLFHRGNLETDSRGCVLLGKEFGTLGGKPAVLLSRLAFTEFMKRAEGRSELRLRVREVPDA